MSTSSGLRPGVRDSRRSIDIVQHIQKDEYRFIELKVGSDQPLYAMFEVLGYRLLYLELVGARLERKYIYAFSAVSPNDGVLDSLVVPWVRAETMSLFLSEVAQRHADEFIVMVMDQAGWHIAGDLAVPLNMRVIFLPA